MTQLLHRTTDNTDSLQWNQQLTADKTQPQSNKTTNNQTWRLSSDASLAKSINHTHKNS